MAKPRWVELGMTWSDVQSTYPMASRLSAPRKGPATLELKDVDFGGAHWRTVDFIFSVTGRLDRVQLVTREESYDHLQARLLAEPDPNSQLNAGAQQIMDFDSSIQVRICDWGADGVVLTYERPSEAV